VLQYLQENNLYNLAKAGVKKKKSYLKIKNSGLFNDSNKELKLADSVKNLNTIVKDSE
jgi:hypothetical protein